MPFTPFHLGPALLLGALLPRRLDLLTLLVAAVIVDVRAALVVFGPLDGPVHGILTTFVGGTIVAIGLTGAMLVAPRPVDAAIDRIRPADATPPTVLAAAVVGLYSHVLLDAVLYADARPLWPLDGNPFLVGGPAIGPVYGGCLIAGGVGLGLLAYRFRSAAAGDEPVAST